MEYINRQGIGRGASMSTDQKSENPAATRLNGFPVALCTVRWFRGIWSITVPVCPLCGEEHSHGGNDGPEPTLGHRVSHCGHGGYHLVEAK